MSEMKVYVHGQEGWITPEQYSMMVSKIIFDAEGVNYEDAVKKILSLSNKTSYYDGRNEKDACCKIRIPDVFDIFKDRVISLLYRWEKFRNCNPELPDVTRKCIEGSLREINDDYTKSLMEGK
jgi:hypothetical protein